MLVHCIAGFPQFYNLCPALYSALSFPPPHNPPHHSDRFIPFASSALGRISVFTLNARELLPSTSRPPAPVPTAGPNRVTSVHSRSQFGAGWLAAGGSPLRFREFLLSPCLLLKHSEFSLNSFQGELFLDRKKVESLTGKVFKTGE